MGSIDVLSQLAICDTPIFLFQFAIPSGPTEYWSTHAVTLAGQSYSARVLKHNAFQLRASMDPSTDGTAGLTVVLANADGICSEVEQEYGWKGTQVTVQFAFFDLASGTATSNAQVIFRGIANPVQQITESQCRVSFTDRMSMQRTYVPQVRIQRQCPWVFPATLAQRQEAVNGGVSGTYSQFYSCGYSADVSGGCGNLDNGVAFTSCDKSRASCIARGMFQADASNQATRRFGGLEFVPPSILVRGYGDKSYQVSAVSANQALYNDFVPLTYGTGWYNPPVVFARNDGNLTRMEVLLGLGLISTVLKVIVNDIEIPAGQSGVNMTATGWYNVLNAGNRTGTFDPDYTDGSGNPLGDPYGSMAYLSVVVPNALSDGAALPVIDVLVQGLKIQQYDTSGNAGAFGYTNNPAWVLLDSLLRNGWALTELDLGSFAVASAACAATVETLDANGNSATVPTYSCNLLLTNRMSLGDLMRGVRNAANLYFILEENGLLQLRSETALGVQQATQPPGTNSTEQLDGGWPAYEFGDNSLSGILRNSDGSASVTVYAQPLADTPNFISVEFQDELNEYQQDSLSMFDADDAAICGQEINITLPAVGISNFAQAANVMALYLNKSIQGNTYVDFSTSFRAISVNPGDVIAITYARQNWLRQPFRVITIAPDLNYRTAVITAQIYDDAWYTAAGVVAGSGRRQAAFDTGIPRPLIGTIITASGETEFGITEAETQQSDGSESFTLSVSFVAPRQPGVSSAGIPLLSLIATSTPTGGTLAGGATWYYGVSATDSSGNESPLSFLAMGATAAGTNTNNISLQGLSFTASTATFNVYRGTTGADLVQIATGRSPAQTFTDTGLTAAAIPPPDMNYDHANFYWRYEMTPAATAQTYSATTIGNSGLQMIPNEYTGYLVWVTAGTGTGQSMTISSNTASTLTVSPAWGVTPDATSTFVVVEPGWRFGARAVSGPVSISVPPTVYFTVDICGVSANVYNDECPIALSPITPYQLGGGTADTGVPVAPTYGIATSGDGTVTIAGIGFTSLTNTASITAGTFTLHYWDEFSNPSAYSVTADVTATGPSVEVTAPASVPNGTVIQIDSELMLVTGAVSGGYTVTRGAYGTLGATHTASTLVYPLAADVCVLPFVPHLFGTPASGEYSYTVSIPHVRIAASELFMTNAFGNSGITQSSVTDTTDQGLRTLTGGQITIQIQGNIAIQTGAAPPFVVDSEKAIRDIYAVVGQAPSGGAVVLNVTVNGTALCTLTIADGATISNVVGGFGLTPLQEQAQVNADITSVPGASNDVSAVDLTVTIRL